MEKSAFWTTNGTGDGPGSGYTQAQVYDIYRRLFTNDSPATQGVLGNVDEELLVAGAATPLTVHTGAAVVYGLFYINDADLTLNVTTPGQTTGGRVVLEAGWVAQTVRAKVVMNTVGNQNPPALVQNAGATWQLSLATFTVTAGGAITLTDTRVSARFASVAATENLADQAITAAKLADLAVTTAKLDNLAVTNGKIADDAVDDAKAGNRIMVLTNRQGGDPANWKVAGSNNYVPTTLRVQVGYSYIPNGTQAVSITFPVAYSVPPLLFLTPEVFGGLTKPLSSQVYTNYANVGPIDQSTVTAETKFAWMAIGPA